MTRALIRLFEASVELANALVNQAADLLRPSRCDHGSSFEWRPALYEGRPARVCRYCKRIEPLTREEFFSIFGEAIYSRLVEAEKEYYG